MKKQDLEGERGVPGKTSMAIMLGGPNVSRRPGNMDAYRGESTPYQAFCEVLDSRDT